jgi:hypothetical protein
MVNGFEIQIGEEEFKKMPPDEQNWRLFQGVSVIRKCVNGINEEGCEYAKKKKRISFLKLASAISAGVTFALGVVFILWQMTCK